MLIPEIRGKCKFSARKEGYYSLTFYFTEMEKCDFQYVKTLDHQNEMDAFSKISTIKS